MSDEEYAIVSKKEFEKLRDELNKLKKNPLGSSPSGENLQSSVESLNLSLNSMVGLFKEAADEMKIEERETQVISKKLEPIEEKINTLIEQNQKIAKGVITVVDLVKEKLESIEKLVGNKHLEHHEERKMPPLGRPPMPQQNQDRHDFDNKPQQPNMGPPGMNNFGQGMPPPPQNQPRPQGMPPPMPGNNAPPGMPPMDNPFEEKKKSGFADFLGK